MSYTANTIEAFDKLVEAIAERLRRHDSDIEELKKRLSTLEKEPRKSFNQKIKERL